MGPAHHPRGRRLNREARGGKKEGRARTGFGLAVGLARASRRRRRSLEIRIGSGVEWITGCVSKWRLLVAGWAAARREGRWRSTRGFKVPWARG